MRNKNILVTGGAGFIGSNLCKILLKNHYNVSVIDNLSMGKKKSLPKEIKFIKGDILNHRS